MAYDFDLFTIGAGSGGVRASRMAAHYGAKVGIAEEYRVGGTCVIRGCVPKKLLVYASQFAHDFEEAAGFGWTVNEARFDWETLIANKDREIERLSQIYRKNLETAGVKIFETRAFVKDPHTVHLVSEGRDVTARRILIATGASPRFPEGVEGLERAISSNEAFHLAAFPRHVTIVGGGYIAVEFAGIFRGLGADVTLVHYGPRILRTFDHDLGDALLLEMRRQGIVFHLHTFVKSIRAEGGRSRVHLHNGEELVSDAVLFAVGRRPHTDGLGLEDAGVMLGRHGAVIVDQFSRTSVPSIFAIGDVTDRLMLTPVAIREGIAFAETEFNANPQAMSYETVATAIFSQPAIGTVGLSETQALDKYGSLDIYKTSFRALKNTLSGSEERTLMKLVVDPESDRVVGCHIVSPDAGEMIQPVGIAIKMGATKRDFDATVAVHPTAAEELVLMRTKTRVTR